MGRSVGQVCILLAVLITECHSVSFHLRCERKANQKAVMDPVACSCLYHVRIIIGSSTACGDAPLHPTFSNLAISSYSVPTTHFIPADTTALTLSNFTSTPLARTLAPQTPTCNTPCQNRTKVFLHIYNYDRLHQVCHG